MGITDEATSLQLADIVINRSGRGGNCRAVPKPAPNRDGTVLAPGAELLVGICTVRRDSDCYRVDSEGARMTTPTPADFAPVGKRFTIIVEVTEPELAQAFIALSLGIPIDDSRLVAGCKVIDVIQADERNLVHAMRRQIEQAIEVLGGDSPV